MYQCQLYYSFALSIKLYICVVFFRWFNLRFTYRSVFLTNDVVFSPLYVSEKDLTVLNHGETSVFNSVTLKWHENNKNNVKMLSVDMWKNNQAYWSLVGLLVIDVELGREDHGSIPATAIGGNWTRTDPKSDSIDGEKKINC
jgi:hypothetical protein